MLRVAETIIDGREPGMIRARGGPAFEAVDWHRLEHFILGDNNADADVVRRCLDADGARVVEMAASVSELGAPSGDSALFVLALAVSADDPATRTLAHRALPRVVRTAAHMSRFTAYVDGLAGDSVTA